MFLNRKIFLLSFLIVGFLIPGLGVYAQKDELASSSEIGVMVSYYYYAEPDVSGGRWMNQRATNVGVDYIGTLAEGSWFFRGDLSYAYGKVKYRSHPSGSKDNEPTWHIEPRLLFGKNIVSEKFILAPFMGFGYRYLYNDGRGTTTTNSIGYRRESNYLYLPFGIIHKLSLTEQAKLITTAEFDYLYWGKQISRYSDTNPRSSDIPNVQRFGYGLRLNIMYRYNNWAIGPFVNYWHVNTSDRVPVKIIDKNGTPIGDDWIVEPKNYTVEAGLRVSYRF